VRLLKKVLLAILLSICFFALFFAIYTFAWRYFSPQEDTLQAARDYIVARAQTDSYTPVVSSEKAQDELRLFVFCDTDKGVLGIYVLMDVLHERMLLVNIPTDARASLSEGLYRNLTPMYPLLPQVFDLSKVQIGMGKSAVYEDIALVYADVTGWKADGYVVLAQADFEDIFNISETGVLLLGKSFSENMMLPVNLRSFVDFVGILAEQKPFETNLSVKTLCLYAEYFEGLYAGTITIEQMPGQSKSAGFEVDVIGCAMMEERFLSEGRE
jgi:hypothetical protein